MVNLSDFYSKHNGESVRVVMTDGEVFTGVLFGYISAMDNEPDPESVIIGKTELMADEISVIEVLK